MPSLSPAAGLPCHDIADRNDRGRHGAVPRRASAGAALQHDAAGHRHGSCLDGNRRSSWNHVGARAAETEECNPCGTGGSDAAAALRGCPRLDLFRGRLSHGVRRPRHRGVLDLQLARGDRRVESCLLPVVHARKRGRTPTHRWSVRRSRFWSWRLPGGSLRRITLPLAAPLIVAAALIVFVLAVSEFGVPGLLRVRVYTTEVFTAFAALYDFSRALVLAIPLLALCAVIGAVAARLLRDRIVSARRLTGSRPALFDNWRRPGRLAVAAVFVVAVVLPVAVLARESLNVRSLRAPLSGSGEAIANSLMLSAISATVISAVAMVLGYTRARAGDRVGHVADILFVVLFAVPSTIVGVALIGLWNRPGPWGAVYGTDAMFILAYLSRFMPVAALILAAAVRYVPLSHEEAAAAAGAGWFRTVWRIVLPQLRLGLAAAWIVVFVLSFGELGASVLIAPPGESTLPIRIYTIIANAPPAPGRPSRPPASDRRLCAAGDSGNCCIASPFDSCSGRPERRRGTGGSLTSTALSVRSISKRFGSHQALDRVSLEVPPSACVVILGPSGCGKTTLLRVIAGLETPDSGEIWMGGTQATAGGRLLLAPHERRIGFVFQDLALWPHLTVRQNLGFVLEAQRVPPTDRSARVAARTASRPHRDADRPLPSRTVRRGAAARRACACRRRRAADLASRRAIVEPRRGTEVDTAAGTRATSAQPSTHDALRHPRSRRRDGLGRHSGRDAWRPNRVHQRHHAEKPRE